MGSCLREGDEVDKAVEAPRQQRCLTSGAVPGVKSEVPAVVLKQERPTCRRIRTKLVERTHR
eukprot:scaffold227296_cov32-Tisochrysis_lutea.AAC.3